MKLLTFAFLFIALFFSPFVTDGNKSFNRERTFDVQHYIMRLNFNHKRRTVFGHSTIKLKPLEKNFRTLVLDAKNIKFSDVRLTSTETQLEYKNSKEKITVALDKSYNRNDLISIDFRYTAKPKKGIYFVDAKHKNGKQIHSQQIWTQGESEETHHWLPSFDFPDDKATTEQFITVKNGLTVIGNGELIEKIPRKNKKTTFHYKMSVPHSLYLTSFIVGKYEKVEDKYKNIPLGYYVYPEQKSIVPKAYGKTKDMFRIFEELTGIDYPYNKYDQTVVANFNFGGMENITATTMSDSEIEFAKFEFARGAVEDLVSHELAHSWFGNLVTCRNWAELWLNEGFATFMEAAYREKMYGRDDYIRKIQDDANQYFAYAANLKGNQHGLFNTTADARNDDTMFDTITYQKGSAVVHTLREEIGDEAFWKGVNLYLTRHKFANVETPDLQKVFEETSGKNLDWFFKQWVYAEGYPKLRIASSYNTQTDILRLEVSQLQKMDEDTPTAFILPLEFQIKTRRETKKKKILINQRKQIFNIKLNQTPHKIEFDKNYKIPLKIISKSKLKIFDSIN